MPISAAQLIAHVSVEGAEESVRKLEEVGKKAKESARETGKEAVSLGEKLHNVTDIADSFGIVTGIDTLKEQLFDTVKVAIAHQQVMTQTLGVLKSTGDASGMTAEQIGRMAEELALVTPFATDSIQSAENLTLTFTNIGKSVFPQVTEAILNISQAMGQDLKSSAIQVGKALNDPLHGMSALQRIGVTFDETQKKLVKSYMAHNEVAKAQGVILRELQREFGNSAKAAGQTLGGQMQILGNRFDQFKEKMGTALLPVLNEFTGLLFSMATPALEKLSDIMSKDITPELQAFGTWLGEATSKTGILTTTVLGMADDAKSVGDFFQIIGRDILIFGKGIFEATEKSGFFQEALKFIKDILPDVAKFVESLGSDLDQNLLPPLESLIENVGSASAKFLDWLDKSGTAKGALSDLGTVIGDTTYVLGQLIQGVSDIVGWLSAGGVGPTTLEVAIGLVGAAFLALKIADTAAQFGQFFSKMGEGNGVVTNLADSLKNKLSKNVDEFLSKQAPSFKKSMDDFKKSSDDATASEEKVGTTAKGQMAADVETGAASSEKSVGKVTAAAETAAVSEEKVGTTAETKMAPAVETASTESAVALTKIETQAAADSTAEVGVGVTAETKMAPAVESASASSIGAVSGLLGYIGMAIIGTQQEMAMLSGNNPIADIKGGNWTSLANFFAAIATPGGWTQFIADQGKNINLSAGAAPKTGGSPIHGGGFTPRALLGPPALSTQNGTITVNAPPVYLDGRLVANALMPHIASAIRSNVGGVLT